MTDRYSADQKMNEILSHLKRAYRTLIRKEHIAQFCVILTVLMAGILTIIQFESALYLTAFTKSLFLILLLAAVSLISVNFIRTVSKDSFKAFYSNFFIYTGEKKLLNAVDLHLDTDQKTSRFYDAAISANIKDSDPKLLDKNLSEYVKSRKASKYYRLSGLFFLITLIATATTALKMPDESKRALTFWDTFTRPNPYNYTITPADTTIEHGSSIPVSIQFAEGTGSLPNQVILEFKTDLEESYRQRSLIPRDNHIYQSDALSLNSNISYRVVMDEFRSDLYTINVQQQPRFEQLSATIEPPSYTGLSERKIEYPFSQINLYRGSTLRFSGVPNKPVTNASISGNNDEQLNLQFNHDGSEQLTVGFQPQVSDTIRFHLTDADGLQNRNPYRVLLNVRNDQYPIIVIQQPVGTVMKNNPESIDIHYQATDDFGLTRAQLVWQLQRAFVDQPEQGNLTLARPVNGRNEVFRWDLNAFDLRPRDQLTLRIRVWDNDEISGYKMSESQPVTIQIPSLAEYFDDLDDRERNVQGELDQISDDFSRFGDEYREFLERLMQNPDGGFEEEQFLEDLRERQQMIDESVREMNQNFERLSEELSQNDRISEETRRAYQELQQLMQELDDPALREAMEELQRALESISQRELEQALENVAFNENLYRERIERTVELFKRLKMNSDLEKLATQYEDLAERLQQSQDQTLERLQSEFQTVREDLDQISEQLDQIDANPPRRSEQRLRQLKEEGLRELDDIKGGMENLMDDASESLQRGEESPAEELQQNQNRMSEQMMAESQRFRSSIEQMSGQQIQVNIVALQRALYTLLELSDMQEYLTRTSSETRTRSAGYADLARLQKNVSDQFNVVADTLFQVSAELPGIPNQVNRKKAEVERTLSRTLDNMIERNQRGSVITTRESLGGINDLSSMISSLIDQIQNQQNGDGGGGMSMQQMIEQLQNMSQDQQALNEELQNLINDAQGNRLTQDQTERLDQIARQQNEIRRQLRELQQRGALSQGDRALSDLQRMLEDMEDSINDMRGGITDPVMVHRQQNILSRMLNAEQSLQQRGEDDEREGTAVTDFDRVLPPDMTLQELEQEIRARMQDPNYTRFSAEYQRLIERYFERLRRRGDEF